MTGPAEGPTGRETLERLRRRDKHYLAAGDGTIFDPTHPLWLDRPGFWDDARYFLHTIEPLFTLSLVLPDGRPLALTLLDRTWTPAALHCRWRAGPLELEEHRVVRPGGRFVSAWRIHNAGAETERFAAVAWTAQDGGALTDRGSVQGDGDGVSFVRVARDAQGRLAPLALESRLTLEAAPTRPDPGSAGAGAGADPTPAVVSRAGWAVAETQLSRTTPNAPDWELSPLRDRWTANGLPGSTWMGPAPQSAGRTLVHAGVARWVTIPPGRRVGLAAGLRVWPADEALRVRAEPAAGEPLEASTAAWAGYFESAPAVASSDAHLDHYMPYRWYGLRLNFLDPAGGYAHPTMAEGIQYFHCAISYSAWCHVRELRWLPDAARARGAILTFLEHQRPDGMLPGRVYLTPSDRADYYLADWGGSLLALDAVHPDRAFLERCYGPLAHYAEWLDRDRDAEGSGLYDVRDPYETGQENMSRYTAVDPDADRQVFEFRLRLKGVDATVYAYRLRRALARVAAAVGRPAREVRVHDAVADRIADAVRRLMWDDERGLFSDVDPRTMTPTGVKAAVCFYPYMTDLAGPEQVAGLERHLFDAREFWTPYPVPSTSADDPTFDAEAAWRGVRQNCTWNGRVWPMTNSHLVDALGTTARRLAPRLRRHTGELLLRYLRMLFFEGDPARPNCFEHYSPVTGRPCAYRGIDDYQHSWVNDLIVRYVFGVQPRDDGGLVVDPLPTGVTGARLMRLPYRGHTLAVTLDDGWVRVETEGQRLETRAGEPLEVRW